MSSTTTVSDGAGRRGRPRAFDRERALGIAVRLFWERGYEATSVADLTAAMGIKPPSLYAAFGGKRALFTEALARYGEGPGAFSGRALAEEPTARAAVARLLREAAVEYAAPGRPAGCMVITAATNCSTSEVVADLRARRLATRSAVEARIAAGVRAGELPAGTDTAALAAYVATVLQGLSQQARDGATAAELGAVAELALAVWPGGA
ncbi:TetR/AcrR family transcriptional regulator [Streptomyces sp. P6-2-1]|uniref:TetR/AcrR family transcriptional regulator n=1 Tax=Streptomyces sp. P6-2-1 TaxID=3422591 RepID=UPI003D363AFD